MRFLNLCRCVVYMCYHMQNSDQEHFGTFPSRLREFRVFMLENLLALLYWRLQFSLANYKVFLAEMTECRAIISNFPEMNSTLNLLVVVIATSALSLAVDLLLSESYCVLENGRIVLTPASLKENGSGALSSASSSLRTHGLLCAAKGYLAATDGQSALACAAASALRSRRFTAAGQRRRAKLVESCQRCCLFGFVPSWCKRARSCAWLADDSRALAGLLCVAAGFGRAV